MPILADIVIEYLTDVAMRCTVATVTHYRKRLSGLVKTLGNSPLPEISEQRILDYLKTESHWQTGPKKGEEKAPDTVRANVVAWQQFQRWLIETKRIDRAITTEIRKPGGRRRDLLPTRDETRKLIAAAPEDFRPIYLALRLTGARPGELCNATIDQIDRVNQELVITRHKTANKTGAPRRIAIGHESLIQIFAQAIGDRSQGRIFVRTTGIPWTTDSLSAAYRSARKNAGLRSGLVLYLSRHEHATEIYKKTGDLKAVADALGHSKLETSQRYARRDPDQAKARQRLFDDSLD